MKWEKSKMEQYAEDWLAAHGFEFTMTNQYISKSEYHISKNDTSLDIVIPYEIRGAKEKLAYMNNIDRNFHIKEELAQLRHVVNR